MHTEFAMQNLGRNVWVTKQEWLPDNEKISVHSEMVDILSKVSPGMMKEVQEKDVDISKTICYVKFDKKLTLAQIQKKSYQKVWTGICGSLIGWFSTKECCTEYMSKSFYFFIIFVSCAKVFKMLD